MNRNLDKSFKLTKEQKRQIKEFWKPYCRISTKWAQYYAAKNGTAFIQSLPRDGKIYFHEMGYRLSGGMIFKLTEPAANINDMKMMIKFALGEEIFSDEEIAKVDAACTDKKAAQLMVPLNAGTVGEIEGPFGEAVTVFFYKQYYPWVIALTSIAIVVGLIGMYVGKIQGLSIKSVSADKDKK